MPELNAERASGPVVRDEERVGVCATHGRHTGVMSFEARRYANFGTGEPWVARITLGLPDLMNGLPTTPELSGATRK